MLQGVSIIANRMAQQNMAARLVFQECQAGHLPDNDHPQPLRLALQDKEDLLHGQVSGFNW